MMNVTIREARPADAEQLISMLKDLSDEPGLYIALSPGEFNLTVEQEQKVIEEYRTADNSVFLVAETEGRILGVLTCKGGSRRLTRHAATLGMSVSGPWRNKGVGGLLLERVIEWAKGTGIVSRIELFVFARNEMAVHLYEKHGFVREGRRRKAICRDGEFFDDLIMSLLL
jgi:RimJ/RimL family protein N-acetyltransferase